MENTPNGIWLSDADCTWLSNTEQWDYVLEQEWAILNGLAERPRAR